LAIAVFLVVDRMEEVYLGALDIEANQSTKYTLVLLTNKSLSPQRNMKIKAGLQYHDIHVCRDKHVLTNSFAIL